MKLKLVTIYKKGLEKNYKELRENKLYQQNHGASHFKMIYESFDYKNDKLANNTTSIIAYSTDKNKPIGVLLFFHNINKEIRFYKDKKYINVGDIGIYVQPEYRKQGIASKIVKEFESNFIDFYADICDYAVINTFGSAYNLAFSNFKWFIPNNKMQLEVDLLGNIEKSINEKNTRSLKYYLYRKSNE